MRVERLSIDGFEIDPRAKVIEPIGFRWLSMLHQL